MIAFVLWLYLPLHAAVGEALATPCAQCAVER